MKRLTRTTLLYHILKFGVTEERELREAGDIDGAYQIEAARITLHYALLDGVKEVLRKLDTMTEYSIDDKGYWHYDPMSFVHDDFTRVLLEGLKERIHI